MVWAPGLRAMDRFRMGHCERLLGTIQDIKATERQEFISSKQVMLFSSRTPGWQTLQRLGSIQVGLWILGLLIFFTQSFSSLAVFALSGSLSILLWATQRIFLDRMLSENLRQRWVYGSLFGSKLILIIWFVREIMSYYPSEGIPLAFGISLFPASILFEALRLMLTKSSPKA